SIAMLSSFSKIAVLERKKEVAIIKSLGATDREVLFTLWFDSLAISFAAFLISLLITGCFIISLPHIIPDMSFVNFRFPFISLVALGICFTIFVCIYTLLGQKKLVKKMPAELFKQ
ncbi:MAG: FtsX-like permease family protein, partial [Acutalibacteraceae bacterium]